MRRFVITSGLAFLYAPLLAVIVYSFNSSRLVTVWAGASTRWYAELFTDAQILHAAALSVAVGATAASLAGVLGLAAGVALANGRPHGRFALSGLLAASLVMPEIIAGMSLLLLVIALEQLIGWPPRGFVTLVIAHATLGLPYVAAVVRARAGALDPSLAEAAADLGARPGTVFRRITLPLLMPAVMAGWLLAFVLSFDDLVIASFVTGPQATTLPMVVFSAVRLGVSPKINALATLMLLVTGIAIAGAALLARRATRRRGLSPAPSTMLS